MRRGKERGVCGLGEGRERVRACMTAHRDMHIRGCVCVGNSETGDRWTCEVKGKSGKREKERRGRAGKRERGGERDFLVTQCSRMYSMNAFYC